MKAIYVYDYIAKILENISDEYNCSVADTLEDIVLCSDDYKEYKNGYGKGKPKAEEVD